MTLSRSMGLALVLALASTAGLGDEISFGFRPMPPYVMVDQAGVYSGLEYELIVAALGAAGHTVKPSGFPFARLHSMLKSRQIQGGAPVLPSHDIGGAYLTNSFITYHNVVLAAKNRGLRILGVSDLKGLSIMAFQTATEVLGPAYAEAVRGNPRYRENAQQVLQIRTLFAGRIDAAIGETRIFNYYIHAPESLINPALPVEEFHIFPSTNYHAAFLEKKYADDFNRGLEIIKANGVYDKIMTKYASSQPQ